MVDLLVAYLAELNNSPVKMAQHDADPQQAAKMAGLCDADVKLIVEQKHDEIKQRCSSKDQGSAYIFTFHTPTPDEEFFERVDPALYQATANGFNQLSL